MAKIAHTPETREQALKMLAEGGTATAVGAALRVHRTTIAAWRDEAGLPRPRSQARAKPRKEVPHAGVASKSEPEAGPGPADSLEVEAFAGGLFLSGPLDRVIKALAGLATEKEASR